MKGNINYVDGVTVSLLVSMMISKGHRYTINVVDNPFHIFIQTSRLTVTQPT
jgi:hypothetical protein